MSVAEPSRAATASIENLRTMLDGALDTVLPAATDEFGAERLSDSMRYSLHLPGKRIRPLLFLATAEACGGKPSDLLRFAAGLEMIHAYSLIHDDLPAMDDDDLRRGQPTNHMVYGDGMAILAGDGLLTEAFVAMLHPVTDGGVQAHTVAEVARAAGGEGMVGGQAADLLAEGMEPTEDILRSIHRRKTGALLRVAVRAGAQLVRAPGGTIAKLTLFAERFGLAFQIADDIKDEIAPTEVTGKRGGGDRRTGKMTYPALMGVAASRDLCRREMAAAMSELDALGPDFAVVAALATDSVAPALSVASEAG